MSAARQSTGPGHTEPYSLPMLHDLPAVCSRCDANASRVLLNSAGQLLPSVREGAGGIIK